MRKQKAQEMELCLDDGTDVRVRYDYDRGEEQWFDARAGVGSPGYDAYACVTELSFDGIKWSTPDMHPDIDFDKLDQTLMEKIAEAEAEEHAARAEAEYDMFNQKI